MPKRRNGRNTSLREFCKGLKNHNRFLLACHVFPEGDAIGSILAVDSLLRRLGKKTVVVSNDEFPKRLTCLSSKRWTHIDKLKQSPHYFDALVVTDSPNLERIGKVQGLLTPKTVIFNIDHHISNVYFGDYNYVKPSAAASGEVVMDLFRELKLRLNRDEATNLYVALSTDTGSFRYGNTTIHSHRMAAELIGAGVNIDRINEELYATYSLNKINLYSILLSRVKTDLNGKLAWAILRRQDLKKAEATYEDTEGFIDFLKYLKEVKIAFFISESENHGEVKVSFRSKGNHDVNKIATIFGGGGHKKASGCSFQGTAEQAEKSILSHLYKEFRR